LHCDIHTLIYFGLQSLCAITMVIDIETLEDRYTPSTLYQNALFVLFNFLLFSDCFWLCKLWLLVSFSPTLLISIQLAVACWNQELDLLEPNSLFSGEIMGVSF